MAIPGENMDKAWRNPIGEVARFLNTMHGSSYQVFNISQEKYSSKQFSGTINNDYGWPDHQYVEFNSKYYHSFKTSQKVYYIIWASPEHNVRSD
jgi:hypothetical protein